MYVVFDTLDFHVILPPNEFSTQFELRFLGVVVIIIKSFVPSTQRIDKER